MRCSPSEPNGRQSENTTAAIAWVRFSVLMTSTRCQLFNRIVARSR